MLYSENIVTVGGEDKAKLFLFTLSTCIWCRKTKALLADLGVAYSYVDVDLISGDAAEEVMDDMHKHNPQTSFPTVVVNDGEKVILGFDEEAIREVIK